LRSWRTWTSTPLIVTHVPRSSVQQLLAAQRLSLVGGEEREEVELAVGQRDRLAGDAGLPTGQVDLDAVADLDHRAGTGGGRVAPPEDGLHPGHHLAR
jgi:hypothetical protein